MNIRTLDEKEILDAENLFRASFISVNHYEYDAKKKEAFEKYLEVMKKQGSYIGVFEKDLDAAICYNTTSNEVMLVSSRNEDSAKKNEFLLLSFFEKELKNMGWNLLVVHIFSEYKESFEKIGFQENKKGEDVNLSLIEMEYRFLDSYLGKKLKVAVDMPLGSFHPQIGDLIMPVNAGYILSNEFLEDEFQNAYIYGEEEPVEEYVGTVIAIVYRKNGTSVFVVSKKTSFDKKDVINAIGELEQYEDCEINWFQE